MLIKALDVLYIAYAHPDNSVIYEIATCSGMLYYNRKAREQYKALH